MLCIFLFAAYIYNINLCILYEFARVLKKCTTIILTHCMSLLELEPFLIVGSNKYGWSENFASSVSNFVLFGDIFSSASEELLELDRAII